MFNNPVVKCWDGREIAWGEMSPVLVLMTVSRIQLFLEPTQQLCCDMGPYQMKEKCL